MIINHPVLRSFKSFTIYVLIWILVIGIHFAILYSFYQHDILTAVTDSLVFNLLFALVGLSVWFTVALTKPEKSSLFNLIVNHLSSLTLIILLWIASGTFISKLIILDESYHEFLLDSTPWRIISAIFLYSILVLVYYLILYYRDLQEKYQNELRLKEAVIEGELNLLKSQINPHFLFNSLNSINSLTISDNEKAREMIVKLSDFLRYTISKEDIRFSELGKELENIRRYLEIEKVRFGKKLKFRFEIRDDCSKTKIPVMILQPLFENAVKHGVYESTEPINIRTECELQDDYLFIKITNNFDADSIAKKGSGIGLKNIADRLKLIYKHDQLIKTTKSNNEFIVRLFIPLKMKQNG